MKETAEQAADRNRKYAASSWGRRATAAAKLAGVKPVLDSEITITCTNRSHAEVVSYTKKRGGTGACPTCGRPG